MPNKSPAVAREQDRHAVVDRRADLIRLRCDDRKAFETWRIFRNILRAPPLLGTRECEGRMVLERDEVRRLFFGPSLADS